MSPVFEHDGNKFVVKDVKFVDGSWVATVSPISPFRVGVVYSSEEISRNQDLAEGDMSVFVNDDGDVLICDHGSMSLSDGEHKSSVPLDLTVDDWMCVYSNHERVKDAGARTPTFQVGDQITTQEEYDSLPLGTIVLDGARGVSREAIQKRVYGCTNTFNSVVIDESEVVARNVGPFTIVYLPDDNDA